MCTYTYTVADYRDLFDRFGGGKYGVVGVDPDGDLIWAAKSDIVWAYESVVLDIATLSAYGKDDSQVVYAPSPIQRDAFEAR
jgi:hypothetical protein